MTCLVVYGGRYRGRRRRAVSRGHGGHCGRSHAKDGVVEGRLGLCQRGVLVFLAVAQLHGPAALGVHGGQWWGNV